VLALGGLVASGSLCLGPTSSSDVQGRRPRAVATEESGDGGVAVPGEAAAPVLDSGGMRTRHRRQRGWVR
jgi:hypothetical protein